MAAQQRKGAGHGVFERAAPQAAPLRATLGAPPTKGEGPNVCSAKAERRIKKKEQQRGRAYGETAARQSTRRRCAKRDGWGTAERMAASLSPPATTADDAAAAPAAAPLRRRSLEKNAATSTLIQMHAPPKRGSPQLACAGVKSVLVCVEQFRVRHAATLSASTHLFEWASGELQEEEKKEPMKGA